MLPLKERLLNQGPSDTRRFSFGSGAVCEVMHSPAVLCAEPVTLVGNDCPPAVRIENPCSYPGWDQWIAGPATTFFHGAAWARVLEQIRPYGPMILIVLLFVSPMLGFDFIGAVVAPPVSRLMVLLVR